VANDGAATVTEADVRALAAKLKGLHALLIPAEQALLQAVLRRAAGRSTELPADDGVTWSVRFNPFPYLDAIVADVAGEAGAGSRPPSGLAPG
jgi:hypothetical protein